MSYPVIPMSETTSSNEADIDNVFAVLSSKRRRLVLEHLLGRPSPVAVPELVDRVVTAELNGHERPGELRERVVVSLHHVHLPKLANSGLVEFDPEREEVTIREAATAVEPYLTLARDDVYLGSRPF